MIAALFDADGTLYTRRFGRGLLHHAKTFDRKGLNFKYLSPLVIPFLLNKIKLLPDNIFMPMSVRRLGILIKGLPVAEGNAIFAWSIENYLFPSLHQDMVAKIKEHKSAGHKVILTSAQFVPSLEIICAKLGMDGVVGTEIEVVNGRYTGKTATPVVTGPHKMSGPRDFFSKRKIDIDWKNSFAYGDSFTDYGMFNLVGNPVAVRPDKRLHALAKMKGWDIIGIPQEK
jgi:HAD superfamily hydrolase (TIGR01490 family)